MHHPQGAVTQCLLSYINMFTQSWWYFFKKCDSPSLRSIRCTPSQLHSQQCIPTQHDMLPQHHVYRNELNCECYNITSKLKHSSLMMIYKRLKHVGVILIVLSVFMWNLSKCNCWLIIEVILQNKQCNNKVYCQSSVHLFLSLHV